MPRLDYPLALLAYAELCCVEATAVQAELFGDDVPERVHHLLSQAASAGLAAAALDTRGDGYERLSEWMRGCYG